jgi:hypothetical protein
LPEKPDPHAQVRPPGVLVQTALVSQPPFAVTHSSMSAQVAPSPAYPSPQTQVTPLAVVVQVAFTLQGLGVVEQVLPEPPAPTWPPFDVLPALPALPLMPPWPADEPPPPHPAIRETDPKNMRMAVN